ncbi:hypothetical protein [Bacillus cereus group sp. BfR-BA-01380]|uniref:hypothetical protein n=1 Tax=Bacillus cereus group sp. BfR-BA-01380 TaxID=2920324 RepID=UPI001F574799|nr:hypothetical protein [Bacillus cereus group sp. BfR-BA-01380]
MNYDVTSPVKISNIARTELDPRIGLDQTIDFGAACYNAGATEILKHIADVEFDKNKLPVSKFTNEMFKINIDKYQSLKNDLCEIEQLLLEGFNESWTNLSASESHDHYVQGFIDGYCYLKTYIAHNKGDL